MTGIFFFLFDEAGKEKEKKWTMHLIYEKEKSIFSFFVDKSPIKWSIFVSIRNKNNKEQQTTSNFQPELLTCPFYSFFLAVYRKQNPVHILKKTNGNNYQREVVRGDTKPYNWFFSFFLVFFFYNLWREQQCIPATNKFFVIPLKCFYGMIV